MTLDLTTEPIGIDRTGEPVYLRELWPAEREIQETMLTAVTSEMFRSSTPTCSAAMSAGRL